MSSTKYFELRISCHAYVHVHQLKCSFHIFDISEIQIEQNVLYPYRNLFKLYIFVSTESIRPAYVRETKIYSSSIFKHWHSENKGK